MIFFNNKRGSGAINTLMVTLALLLIFLAVFEYIRLATIISGVKNTAKASISSVAVSFLDDAFYDFREGSNALKTDLNAAVRLRQRFIVDMTANLNLRRSLTNTYSKYSGGRTEFSIKQIGTQFQNGPPVFTARFNLTVPVRFLGKTVYTVNVPIMVQAGYEEKY